VTQGLFAQETMMKPDNLEQPPMEEPLAELERQLIHAYVTGAGHDFRELMGRNDAVARKLLADASLYASDRLSEIEARAHYIRKLHGTE
jgi:hypothetical protein